MQTGSCGCLYYNHTWLLYCVGHDGHIQDYWQQWVQKVIFCSLLSILEDFQGVHSSYHGHCSRQRSAPWTYQRILQHGGC
jgi:hypothetical protein